MYILIIQDQICPVVHSGDRHLERGVIKYSYLCSCSDLWLDFLPLLQFLLTQRFLSSATDTWLGLHLPHLHLSQHTNCKSQYWPLKMVTIGADFEEKKTHLTSSYIDPSHKNVMKTLFHMYHPILSSFLWKRPLANRCCSCSDCLVSLSIICLWRNRHIYCLELGILQMLNQSQLTKSSWVWLI